MKKTVMATLIAVFLAVACSGNKNLVREFPHPLEWERRFGGTGSYGDPSVQQTTDGGYIVADDILFQDSRKNDIWLIKVDAAGTEQWNRTFDARKWDWATAVQQTTDGGYIIAGGTVVEAEKEDVWLIKTDTSGNERWSRFFGGAGREWANDVWKTADGGYIMVGVTSSYGAGQGDVWFIKTDSSGNEQWCKTFGGPNPDYATSVRQTPDGGYVIAGATESYGAGLADVWLIKTDANGNKEWDSVFGGPEDDGASAVQQTLDGGYIVTGSTSSYGKGESDVWIIKVDAMGSKQWDRTFGGPLVDGGSRILQTADGGYIVVGTKGLQAYGPERGGDIWLIKTDVNGELEWDRTFGNTVDYEDGSDIQITSDGGYIIAGNKFDMVTHEWCIWLIKTFAPKNRRVRPAH